MHTERENQRIGKRHIIGFNVCMSQQHSGGDKLAQEEGVKQQCAIFPSIAHDTGQCTTQHGKREQKTVYGHAVDRVSQGGDQQ